MKRDPKDLERGTFDLVVVGAGITGACVAYDAARRGMSVALVDKRDFGSATSSASSKLLHGGVRYLQQLNARKVRESALERIYFQNLAPHLTSYVPFIVPTYRGISRGRPLLAAGMAAYRLLCMGQNARLRDPERAVPVGRGLSAREISNLVPPLAGERITGGRVFYEAHMNSSERMTLAFVDGAVRAGATATNYFEVTHFEVEDDRVRGVRGLDAVSGTEHRLAARVVVNAAGPWIGKVNACLGDRVQSRIVKGFSKGVHIVTRSLTDGYAVALPTSRRNQSVIDRGGRHVFIIPWRGCSLIGTTYTELDQELDRVSPTAGDVRTLIEEVNAAMGPGTLEPGDVLDSFAGIYPLTEDDIDPEVYQGTGDYQIVDHSSSDGLAGVYSVFGAKYTTARLLAERAIDRVAGVLEGPYRACETRREPTPAGAMDSVREFKDSRCREYRDLFTTDTTEHLVGVYGTAIDAVADLARADSRLREPLTPGRSTIKAEVVHAVREEMAIHLEDFVRRRTGFGTIGHPGPNGLAAAAELMAQQLGWSDDKRTQEVASVASHYVNSDDLRVRE